MYHLKKILIISYDIVIEISRTIFNKCFYTIARVILKLIGNKNLQVFSDSNGWFITYKYKGYIYKVIGPFLFLKKRFSWKEYKSVLNKLLLSTQDIDVLDRIIPEVSIKKTYIRLQFIDNAISLEEYLYQCNSTKQKIEIILNLFKVLDKFHSMGFIHGDLKPKNILVKENRIYLIDIESLQIISEKHTRVKDYDKLIPRIIYHLNENELIEVCASNLSEQLDEYIKRKYLNKYNLRQHLKKFNFVTFEEESDGAYENDIDIEVPTYSELEVLQRYFKDLNLDMMVFYCCVNDFKIYLYNGVFFKAIDVHLTQYISTYKLFYLKLTRNHTFNIFLSGPDGVGKTTLIDRVIKGSNHNMFKLLHLDNKHGNRFVQDESVIINSRLERFLFCKFLGCLLKKNILLLKFKLLSKSVVTIYDRSFLDIFVTKKISWLYHMIIKLLGHTKHIYLLTDKPNKIIQRKQELNIHQIEDYYKSFKKMKKDPVIINMEFLDKAEYQLSTIIRHRILTRK